MRQELLKQTLKGLLENDITMMERHALNCMIDLLERETVLASKLTGGNTDFSTFIDAHAWLQSKVATNARMINSYFKNMNNAKEKLSKHDLPKAEFIRLKEEYFHNYKKYLESIEEQKKLKASWKELRSQMKSFALLKKASELCSVADSVKKGLYNL